MREAGLPHCHSVAMVKTHICLFCFVSLFTYILQHIQPKTTEIFIGKMTVNNPVGTFTKRRMKHKGLEFNGKVKKRCSHVNGSEYFMQNSVCFSLHSKRNTCIAIAHILLNWVLFTWAKNKITAFQNCINFSAECSKIPF